MGPPMKTAAHKGKELLTETTADNTGAPTAENTTACADTCAQKTKPTLKKTGLKSTAVNELPRKAASPLQLKEMDVSVTISLGDVDIPLELWKKMDEFIEKECISGLCSIERGGVSVSRLHLQMVCRLWASSVGLVSDRIQTYLGWDADGQGHQILTKALCNNTGLHTFIGMLGDCVKDKGEEHFQCVHRNVTRDEIRDGVQVYIKYGTPFTKNKIVLTHTNHMKRAAMYNKYKMKELGGRSLPDTFCLCYGQANIFLQLLGFCLSMKGRWNTQIRVLDLLVRGL